LDYGRASSVGEVLLTEKELPFISYIRDSINLKRLRARLLEEVKHVVAKYEDTLGYATEYMRGNMENPEGPNIFVITL
jgi:hypothetical protein